MATSSFIARAPRREGAQKSGQCTVSTFLAILKERHAGRVALLPIRGGRRAKFRKLDTYDSLGIRLDEAVTIIAGSPDEQAVDYLRALTEDSGKAERICIRLAATPISASIADAELRASEAVSKVICLAERKRNCVSIDRKEWRDAELGAEAWLRSLMLCGEMGL